MIRFLFKGLLRDRHRSLFPVIIVACGVMVSALAYSYITGVFGNMMETNARFDTGHVKVTTRAYREFEDLLPNDLAIDNADSIISLLKTEYPDLIWIKRIKFGGLLDFPDEEDNTFAQGFIFGLGVDLLSSESREIEMLMLDKAISSGRLPERPSEAVVSETILSSLGVKTGDIATLIGSTANGDLAVYNFKIVGALTFGIPILDRNLFIADISDVQKALDMEDWTSEILGISPNMMYMEEKIEVLKSDFNSRFGYQNNEFSPVMAALRDQNGLGEYLDYAKNISFIMIFIFVFSMSIVLWNTGLMSGIRRYGEMGVRLAIGESKGHVYRSLINESILVGIIGSIIGTAVGVSIAYYIQEVGIDIGDMMGKSDILFTNVIRAKVSPTSYIFGFIPGLFATLLGSVISGLGIFKRQTSMLMKELES